MERSSSTNPLRGLGEQLLALVWQAASKEQLGQWLRVPLEHAAARHSSSSNALCVKLLQAGADVFVRRQPVLDRSPLLAAAQAGNGDIVSVLLENGSAPDGEDWETSKFLSDVIHAAGRMDSSTPSLACVGNTNGVGFTTPLHVAASGGNFDMVRMLVRAGVDADVVDENGDTPLHLAVFRGFEQVVEELVTAGASVDTIDSEGESPLHTAASHGSLGMVRAILRGSRGKTLLSPTDNLAMSPFHRAALGGHCDVMEELLSHGSSLHSLAGNALTSLHAAAMSSSGDAVRFLLDRDSSNSSSLEAEDREGRTALHLAAGHRLGSDGTLLALLEGGASIEARCAAGETPLHKACKALRVSAVQQLLRFGADEAAVDAEGRTPAALASAIFRSQCPGMFRDMLQIILGLLAAAPADKAWRRRGWLLMLRNRSRLRDGQEEEESVGDGVGDGDDAGGGIGVGVGIKTTEAAGQGLGLGGLGVAVGGADTSGVQLWADEEDGHHSNSSSTTSINKRLRTIGSNADECMLAATTSAIKRTYRRGVICGGGGGGIGTAVHAGGGGEATLRAVVERVVGVCEDGVFRNIITFL